MADPLADTQPGLGPVKKKTFNKKVLVAAILAGFIAAGSQLFPQYADIFNGIAAAWSSYAGSNQ